MAVETEEMVLVDAGQLEQFVVDCFRVCGMDEKDAREAMEVLIKADITGVDSHGVPRLRNYITRLRNGAAKVHPDVRIVHELPATARVDGDNGLGMVVGRRGMEIAIEKAKETGAGFVTVYNSSHYGIAGFYARMALEHDMIGISSTNVGAGGGTPPTGGRTGMFGTNPLAVAVPTKTPPPWVMDFATTVVAAGKLQIATRRNHDVPLGWIMDRDGNLTTKVADRGGGGYILPLGGLRETGGHKGYGLQVLVDILTAVLSGAAFGANMAKLTASGAEAEGARPVGTAANTGHFFGALRIDGFRPVDEFKEAMDEMCHVIRSSEKLPGWDRVYTHGEIDWETEIYRRANGVPLDVPTYESLEAISIELEVPLNIRK